MDMDLGSEQSVLLASIEPLLARYRALPQPQGSDYFVLGGGLDAELDASGFYGGADGFPLDQFDAALVLEAIAQCPYAVPAMASLIVAPALKLALARPIALMASPTAASRFLGEAKTALIDMGDAIVSLDLTQETIEPVTTIFAYPYARLAGFDPARATRLAIDPAIFRAAWRLGVVFEILGALRSAHALTVDYVKQREQFRRRIGSFQAVQHRLGEGATRIAGVGLLAARGALGNDPGEIALAATYAQQAVPQIVHDCHQFHGAMGVTLEYVLHHWTYRLKVLAGELGGASGAGRAAAQALWVAA